MSSFKSSWTQSEEKVISLVKKRLVGSARYSAPRKKNRLFIYGSYAREHVYVDADKVMLSTVGFTVVVGMKEVGNDNNSDGVTEEIDGSYYRGDDIKSRC